MHSSIVIALSITLLSSLVSSEYYPLDDYNEIGDSTPNRRPVINCVSGKDCASDECSVMGMQRYSEPRCEPRGGLGSPCRMYDQEPSNKTLSFPHVTMECQDVYMQFCPCAEGLVCEAAECRNPNKRRPFRLGRFH